MAYSQHEWVNGEIITAEKLNNIEQGIADGEAREIAASASATVDNSAGEPSCEVAAEGSVSGVDFKFAFKGIKGETGKSGVTPLFQKTAAAIQVSLDNGESWSDLVALDDIRGEDAPTVISQEINITGNVISGTTYYSDGSTSPIAGVYTAEGGDGSDGDEENPDVGDSEESETEPEDGGGNGESGEEEEDGDGNDNGDNGAAGGAGEGETVEGELGIEGGGGED